MSAPLSRLARHLTGDPQHVPDILADRVHFASPYADYDDRAHIAHLFTVMPGVFDQLRVVRQVVDGEEIVTVLTGRVGEHELTAVLDEILDAGRTREATLLVRPLAASRAAITRMGQLLG